ncbi:hypothetical protein MIND_00793300 [Mycena indigotica]|uniref:Nop14-like protein n=1 Tax=Mycena indigotica TaxID=2126181 RepID=A0A8H6SQ02_9AGAR|nr:uncharacterized protein MIND_00793300 [Mycena indigotica]KAF7302262.1 hypothetical protein MIND_00793300 [Mycena indigotica]
MAKKGSQLSQLKAALSKAGVTGSQQQNGKKRKRPAGAQEKDKAKRAAKLEEIHKRLNPFDVKVTKLKHDVGGRKVKGVSGKPAQSRQAGLEQRKKTLLKEYEDKGRAGGILDRRFGENDPSMSLEDRMLERFTRERQRSSKGVAFNLEDEDELTHYGQSLSKFDDFDGAGSKMDEDSEEEEPNQIDGDVVRKTHFKGFSDDEEGEENQPDRVKSKAEVMAEVIAKSKTYKLQHQMEREEEDNVRHELDQQFDDLRALLYSAPKPAADDDSSTPPSKPTLMDTDIVPQDGNYDQRVRELAFESRAKPKDRMKTEEEVARAEKEALEKAERARRKRMLGLEKSDSEDENGRSKKRRRKDRGGDDLDDDFALDEDDPWEGIGAGLEEQQATMEPDEDEDDEEEDSGDEGGSGSEEEDSESDIESGEHENLTSAPKPSKGKSKAPDKELPFTFPCPSTHEELLDILEHVDDKDIPTVIHRIRSLFHTSLAPQNKFKLQTLAAVLIDHILYVSNEGNFSLVSALVPHLFALTRAYPVQTAQHFVAKITLMHKNLRRGLSRGALDVNSKTWPGLSELALLRIIGTAWPTSDLNHAVISPTRVLISAYLGLARVRSATDIASGLFLCSLVLQYETLSKRFVPEAVNFAINCVLHLAPHGYSSISEIPGSFPVPDFPSNFALKKALKKELPKADLAALLVDSNSVEAKSQLLLITVDLLSRFAEMYKPLDGFIELYQPILDILLRIRELHPRIGTAVDMLSRLLKFAKAERKPLLLQAHKPIPIPTYVPKFEMSKSSYLRNQDPDKERNEAAKLRAQYKQERKGAIRELRKDARFLAGVEQERQREKDRAYGERMQKVVGEIQTERAEEKAMEREKAKQKKRAGRK